MNRFYQQPLPLLWIEAIILMSIGFFPAILIIEAASDNPFFYLLFLLYLPFAQFSLTPLMRLAGVYKYYSPMLLGYNPTNIQIDLHSGTSFDYLFVMRKYKPGIEVRNVLLLYYLEGLLNIIQQIEEKKIQDSVHVIGTSYFFNERTISKLGFTMSTPSFFYRLNILLNFVDLTWMYSMSKGSWSLPNLWKVKKVNIIGKDLIENKKIISDLHENLQAKVKKN